MSFAAIVIRPGIFQSRLVPQNIRSLFLIRAMMVSVWTVTLCSHYFLSHP